MDDQEAIEEDRLPGESAFEYINRKALAAMTPLERLHLALWVWRGRFANKVTAPLARIPLVGNLSRVFWICVITEGDPRDGMIFSFLNDGMHPTIWHTIVQIRRDDDDEFVGIWPHRAPRSEAGARELLAEFAKRREGENI